MVRSINVQLPSKHLDRAIDVQSVAVDENIITVLSMKDVLEDGLDI